MKKPLYILLFIVVLAPVSLFSQSYAFEYSYDESGNRVEKVVIYLRKKSVDAHVENSDSALYKEDLGKYAISVFPNPTEGAIEVKVENFDSQLDASAFIFSENGKFVSKDQELNPSNVFDLTDKPSGVYFLKIVSKEESKTWKIIKL